MARVIALLAVLLVVLASGEVAHAASVVWRDSRHDTYAPDAQDYQHFVPIQSMRGDVTSVRIRHRVKAVNVVIHTRRLGRGNAAMVDILTSAKRPHRFVLTAARADGSKFVTLTKGFNREVKCDGLRVRFDGAQAVIRAHIPRRCLDNPRWVRAGVMLMTFANMQSGALSTVDVGGKRVLTDRWWNNASLRVPHSPRVRVG